MGCFGSFLPVWYYHGFLYRNHGIACGGLYIDRIYPPLPFKLIDTSGNHRTELCRTQYQKHGMGPFWTVCWLAHFYTPFLSGFTGMATVRQFWLFSWKSRWHNWHQLVTDFFNRAVVEQKSQVQ